MKTFIFLKKLAAYIIRFGAIVTGLIIAASCIVQAQNVGIGIDNPTEKLQVNGIVHSVVDGFRFPDGTLQSSASTDYEPQDAGDNRWIIILKCVNPAIIGSFSFDTLVNVIKVVDYAWGMISVPEPGGGGEVTINTVKIIKNIEASTNPLLHRALLGQVMPELRLYFFMPTETGMRLYYKFIMHNILITNFIQEMVYKGGQDYSHMDIIEFQFEQADWEYNDGVWSNNTSYP